MDGCTAGAFGGGLYLYSGSTTIYNCSVTNCSADLYGGGIMQDMIHDLFWYGGTVKDNHAVLGGGGMALYGFYGGSSGSPRGAVFNYPVTANNGFTNPTYYKSAILANKIVAPSILRANTQGLTNAASDVWTNALGASSRIDVRGSFVDGSKIGVIVSEGLVTLNTSGAQFGTVYQSSANLVPFANDVNATLVAAANGTRLVWADGFVVDYQANAPLGSTLTGSAPFDGADGMANALRPLERLGHRARPRERWPSTATRSGMGGCGHRYRAALPAGRRHHLRCVARPAQERPYGAVRRVAGAPRVCQIVRDTNGDGTPGTRSTRPTPRSTRRSTTPRRTIVSRCCATRPSWTSRPPQASSPPMAA